MATDLAPLDKRASAIARMSLFQYAGIALGPTIASQLIHHVTYDAVWWLASVFAVIGLALTVRAPESGGEAMARRAELGRTKRRLIHRAAIGPGLVRFVHRLLDIGVGGGAYLVGAVADAAGFGAAYALPATMCLSGAVLLAVIARPSPSDRSPARSTT